MTLLANAFGIAGSALLIAMVLPQIAVVLRDKSAAGVSLSAWGMYTVLSGEWLVFGLRADLPVAAVANSVCLPLGIAALIVVARAQRAWAGLALWLGVVATVSAAVGTLALPVVGTLIVVVGLAAEVPQLLTSLRTWRAGTASETSITTWILAASAVACLGIYGAMSGSAVLVITSGVSVTARLCVVALERSTRRRLVVSAG